MWKPLQNSPPYFINFYKETNDLYHITVTDYKLCWINNTTRKSFLAHLMESNEGLEFDDQNELVTRGLDMLNTPETLKRVSVLQEEPGLLTVSMTKVYEISLRLELKLLKASSEHFYFAVIQPLLKTVCDLRSSQNELRQLLLKKDREIEEYKVEGKAPRRLITTVYDDEAHMTKHTTFEEFFGESNVPDLLESTAKIGKYENLKSLLKKNNNDKKPLENAQKPPVETKSNGHHNEPIPVTSIPESSIKVEKCSQNTPPNEILSYIPTQTEETGIPGLSMESPVKCGKNIKSESNNSIPTKRFKNRLNY